MIDSKEVIANLEIFINDILPQKIAQGLEKSAQMIENEAKINCPVDTGHLRASISHEVKGTKAVIGTNVEYGAYVHERTKPFLQQAVDNNLQEIMNSFKGVL